MKRLYRTKYLPIVFFLVLSGATASSFIKNASAAQRLMSVFPQTYILSSDRQGREEHPFAPPVCSALAFFPGHGVNDDALTAIHHVCSSQKTNHTFFTGLFNRLKLHIRMYVSAHRSRGKGIDDDPSDDTVILTASSSAPRLDCLTFSIINTTLMQSDVIRKPFIPPRG